MVEIDAHRTGYKTCLQADVDDTKFGAVMSFAARIGIRGALMQKTVLLCAGRFYGILVTDKREPSCFMI